MEIQSNNIRQVMAAGSQDVQKDNHDGLKNFEDIETTTICWQLQNAIAFATAQNRYIKASDLRDFMETVVRVVQNDDRWVRSFAIWFSKSAIDDGQVVEMLMDWLSQYSLDHSALFEMSQFLNGRAMPAFRALTYASAATAFGDPNTAEELMSQCKP